MRAVGCGSSNLMLYGVVKMLKQALTCLRALPWGWRYRLGARELVWPAVRLAAPAVGGFLTGASLPVGLGR